MEDTKKLIEKYKRELMEMSRTAPRPATSDSPALPPEEKPPVKAPKIIGYVTEESGEFPAVFDKFITDAVENNVIETVSAPPDDEEEIIVPQQDLFDSESGDPQEDDVSNDVPNAEKEPETPQIDMAQGSGESISNFPVPEYSSIEEFEANNTGGGFLEFRVFAAEQALPVEGAEITVTVRINGQDYPLIRTTANCSGETDLFTLPAPSAELSQDSENTTQPFSLYNATVNKDGYTNVIIRDIPIFDGVQSVQRVAMLPETENGSPETITEVPDAK